MTKYARANWEPGMAENMPPEGDIELKEILTLPQENPDDLFVVVPPGAKKKSAIMEELEETHYTPDTHANAKFELFLMRWPEELPESMGLVWGVFVIPGSDRKLLEAVADKHGYKLIDHCNAVIAGYDSRLGAIESGGRSFPLKGENVHFFSPKESQGPVISHAVVIPKKNDKN